MNYSRSKFGIAGAAVCLLILAGCLLSGTFVSIIFITDKDFTAQSEFYYYYVDLTDDDVWKDHKDNIKDIDLVGFELWVTNHETTSQTFSIYLDDASHPQYTSLSGVEANTTKVLDDLTLAAGPDVQAHITYGQSFKYLRNVETLKNLVDAGAFHYYGVSNGGSSAGYTIDSVRVVITFTAGV